MKAYISIIGLLALLAISHQSLAQDSENQPESISFEFKTILLGRMKEGTPKRLYYRQGNEYQAVTFIYQNLGLKHRFSGPWPFQFYEEIQTPEGLVMKPFATINEPPPEASKIFLLVIPEDLGLKTAMLPATSESLPPGQLRVLNFSLSEIALTTGDADSLIRIPPGDTAITKYEVEDERFAFNLKVAASDDDAWKIVHSSMVTQVNQDPLFAVVSNVGSGSDRWRVRFMNLASF